MAFNHISYVRSGHPDITHRQMAMLLVIHRDEKSTVRGLAEELDVQKPVITRGADALVALGFVRRVRDTRDRRNVFIVPRPKLARFLAEVM